MEGGGTSEAHRRSSPLVSPKIRRGYPLLDQRWLIASTFGRSIFVLLYSEGHHFWEVRTFGQEGFPPLGAELRSAAGPPVVDRRSPESKARLERSSEGGRGYPRFASRTGGLRRARGAEPPGAKLAGVPPQERSACTFGRAELGSSARESKALHRERGGG